MNTPTPETDALLADMTESAKHWAITDLARKLERERDEARKTIRKCNDYEQDQRVLLGNVEAERDQLRKVCDELAKQFSELEHQYKYTLIDNKTALAIHNSLPHVIAKKGTAQ